MKTMTIKPSTKVQEIIDFFAEAYPDEARIGILTLKGNPAGSDRRLRALTEKDLTGGIEIELKKDIEESLELIRKKLGVETWRNYSAVNLDDALFGSKSSNGDLEPQEWYDFSNKIREKNILPELTFIFDDVLSNFDTDNHYPFFYTEDVLVANQFTSFIYANIDGIYTSINGDDLSLIMTWDKIKIDEDMGDGIYYVDEDDSPEPEHLTLGTEDEQFLSLSKDKALYFIEYMWNDIIKDITNLSRDGVVIWNEIEKKLGIERKQFNSWDEIREFINS